MRLWSIGLLEVLPKKQLQGQWKEIGTIWHSIEKKGTPNHLLVNKVLDYSIDQFKRYSSVVFLELTKRGVKVRRSKLDEILNWEDFNFGEYNPITMYSEWFDDVYLRQCLYNLEEKYICGGIPEREWKKIYDKYCDKFDLTAY